MAASIWLCPKCGYEHFDNNPPDICPECGTIGDEFYQIEE